MRWYLVTSPADHLVVGRKREVNEDQFLIAELSKSMLFSRRVLRTPAIRGSSGARRESPAQGAGALAGRATDEQPDAETPFQKL